MIKFLITPARFAEACGIIEYLNASAGDRETVFFIAPRFVLNEAGEYVVKVTYDDDGDIKEFTNLKEAQKRMALIPPQRLEKLVKEFREAAKSIVNPPNGTG